MRLRYMFVVCILGLARTTSAWAGTDYLTSQAEGASFQQDATQSQETVPTPAAGQATPPASAATSSNPASSGTTSNVNPPLPLSLFPGFGRTLQDDGITIHGFAFDHFLANPTTGFAPGNNYNLGVFAPTIDFDLGKLLGIPGGALHLEGAFFFLRSNIPAIGTEVGSAVEGFQTTPALLSVQNVLSELTYEQKLLDDKLSITVGRSQFYDYFAPSNSLDPFVYFSPVLGVNGDNTAPAFPGWMGLVAYHISPTLVVQSGAFEDNFTKATLNPNNFGVAGASGVNVASSLEYRTDFSNDAYPVNGELGLEWSTRHGPSNTKGAPVPYIPGLDAATNYHGGGVLFVQGQKVIWRGADTHFGQPKNIAVFGQTDVALDAPQPFQVDALVGANFTGLIPGRPFDALGFTARYTRLSEIEAKFETRVQDIFAGPGPSQKRGGFQFEGVANIQALPWLSLRPYVQAYINPDSYYNNRQPTRIRNGFITGFFFYLPLGRMLGTSALPY